MPEVTIDAVARDRNGAYIVLLVEQGPWAESELNDHLRRLQDRLFNCVDASSTACSLSDSLNQREDRYASASVPSRPSLSTIVGARY